jgi:predicted anti-sigma-YlaC factor YlaD
MTDMTDMTRPGCRAIRQLLGVYVVGAIDPAERGILDAHLSVCSECRAELGGLAGLPALLGRVPLADAERMAEGDHGASDLEPPPELLNGLLRRVAARRRNRRWRSALGLAAAVAIAAGGTATVFSAHQHPQTEAQDVVRASNAHVTAMVKYTGTPWGGSAMRVAILGIPTGTVCKFWVESGNNHWSVAGTWTVGPGYGEHWYSVSSSVPADSVDGFQITSQGKTLLNIPDNS